MLIVDNKVLGLIQLDNIYPFRALFADVYDRRRL